MQSIKKTAHGIVTMICRQTDLTQAQAWWLLEHITKKSATQLMSVSTPLLNEEQEQQLTDHLHEIAILQKPLAYILGSIPFLQLDLIITPPTLIPRPETEYWVHELIVHITEKLKNKSSQQKITMLDIGTGSGCIALSLAQAFPYAQIYALDIATQAIQLAQKNAAYNNIDNIIFLQSDLFANLPNNIQFDLIVSNPPYIDPATSLEKSVAAWEDHQALFAQEKGLKIIKSIIKQAATYLKKESCFDYQLIIETDCNQAAEITEIAQQAHFTTIEIKQDQFARDRTLWAKL